MTKFEVEISEDGRGAIATCEITARNEADAKARVAVDYAFKNPTVDVSRLLFVARPLEDEAKP